MSKLYEKYKFLKSNNSSKLYLFKSGIFYIFLDEDAKFVSNILNLKLTNLNDTILKCGFPVSNISKYLNLFKEYNLDVEILDSILENSSSYRDYISNSDIKNFLDEISNINAESLSIKEAYCLIDKIIVQAKDLRNKIHGLQY